MKKFEVICPFCLGEKKIIAGECGVDSRGHPYSITRKEKCPYCDGRGKGDFDITPERVRALPGFDVNPPGVPTIEEVRAAARTARIY